MIVVGGRTGTATPASALSGAARNEYNPTHVELSGDSYGELPEWGCNTPTFKKEKDDAFHLEWITI